MKNQFHWLLGAMLLSLITFSSCKKDPVDETKDPPATGDCYDMTPIHPSHEHVDAISFINAQEGWACTAKNAISQRSIIHTTDGGQNWTTLNSTLLGHPSFQRFYFINSTIGFLIDSESRLQGTKDGGATWTIIVDNQFAGGESVFGLASNSTQTVCYSQYSDELIYISNATLEVTTKMALPDGIGIGGTAAHLSEDGGFTFGPVSRNEQEELVHLDAAGNWSFSPVGGGDSGVAYRPSTAMDFPSESVGYFVGGGEQYVENHVYKTTDGGKTWDDIYTLADHDQAFTLVDFADENNGIAGSESAFASAYQTTDGGQTWTRLDCLSDQFILPQTVAFPDLSHQYLITPIHPFENSLRMFSLK